MTLVFPQAKPIGVNSTSSREAIKDDAAFPTNVIDYLKFDMFRHKDNKQYGDSVYLYLPKKLTEAYGQKWGKVDLGPEGGAALDAASKLIGSDDVTKEDFSKEIERYAKSAMPGIGYKAGASLINTALGATGSNPNLNRDTLSSLTQGKIFNPYAEAVYEGPTGFREHKFNFQLIPKSSADVVTIMKIIRQFRQATLPKKDGKNWLVLPEYFRLKIVRYVDKGGGKEEISNPDNGGMGLLSSIVRFPTNLVMTNFSIDLDDRTSLKSTVGDKWSDMGPLVYNLSLNMKETAYLTKDTFEPSEGSGITGTGPGGRLTESEMESWAQGVFDRSGWGDFSSTNSANIA
tara:strand:- start:1391 stop:2425 length:1035 start_codon:yes stop_codon:yes gene_type:complete